MAVYSILPQSTQLQKNGYLAYIRQCLELVCYMLPAALDNPSGIVMVSVCTGLLGRKVMWKFQWIQDYKPNTFTFYLYLAYPGRKNCIDFGEPGNYITLPTHLSSCARRYQFQLSCLTLMLLLANLAKTKWCMHVTKKCQSVLMISVWQ